MGSSRLEKQAAISQPSQERGEAPKAEVTLQHATWASWLFLAGSMALVVDAILENLAAVTISSGLHLGGSLLFAMGSWLLIPRRPKQ